MKKMRLLLSIFSLLAIGLLNESCKKEESCSVFNCNSGTLNEETCSCDCPDGYTGEFCEHFDSSKVQALLDGGRSPQELFEGNIPLDSIYGKIYTDGIIFYLNTGDGRGMVAAIEDQSDAVKWGCNGIDIIGLHETLECPGMENCRQPIPDETEEGARVGDGVANTTAILAGCTTDGIAAKLCRDLGDDWFLPSRGELNLMYTNLHAKGYGNFVDDWYWNSTEATLSLAWVQSFYFGSQSPVIKGDTTYVRAARIF